MMNNISLNARPEEKKFSLGLTYYEVMDLAAENMDIFLKHTYREEVIDWLQWNDPNGVYVDSASIAEFGVVISKQDAVDIIKLQLLP